MVHMVPVDLDLVVDSKMQGRLRDHDERPVRQIEASMSIGVGVLI